MSNVDLTQDALAINEVHEGDCLELMKRIPDNSINLIVIDPPYNIGKDKRWDKWQSVETYVGFMTEVFKECQRVLKPNGSFYWFHNDFLQIVELQSSISKNTEFQFKSLITIDKSEGSYVIDLFGSKNQFRNYLNLAEYCLFYVLPDTSGWEETGWRKVKNQNNFKPLTDVLKKDIENSGVSLNDIYSHALKEGRYSSLSSAKANIRCKLGLSKGRRFDLIDEQMFTHLGEIIPWSISYDELKEKYTELKSQLSKLQSEYEMQRKELEKKRYTFNKSDGLKNVWSYSFKGDVKTKHPTQKPISLIADIIEYSSNEGDIILDCFLGSGTTAVAAINTNRNFIGIEREPEYVAIANQRIADALEAKGQSE